MSALLELIERAAAQVRPDRPGDRFGEGPLSFIQARDLILSRRYAVDCEALIDPRSGVRRGYRARARFRQADGRAVNAAEVFRKLHAQPALLFHSEIEIKRLAFAGLGPTEPVWIDLDVDAYSAGESEDGNAWIRFLAPHARRVIVEAVENRHLVSTNRVYRMLRSLCGHQFSVARCAESLIPVENAADWVRIDAGVGLHDPYRLPEFLRTVADAQRLGARTLLTGVVRPDDVDIAADLGFDAVSGPVFEQRRVSVWESGFATS